MRSIKHILCVCLLLLLTSCSEQTIEVKKRGTYIDWKYNKQQFDVHILIDNDTKESKGPISVYLVAHNKKIIDIFEEEKKIMKENVTIRAMESIEIIETFTIPKTASITEQELQKALEVVITFNDTDKKIQYPLVDVSVDMSNENNY